MGVANNSTVAVMRVLVAIMTRLRSFGVRTGGTHRDRIFKRMMLNAAGSNPSDAVHPRRIPVSLWPSGRPNRSAHGHVSGTKAAKAPAASKKPDEAGADRTARRYMERCYCREDTTQHNNRFHRRDRCARHVCAASG